MMEKEINKWSLKMIGSAIGLVCLDKEYVDPNVCGKEKGRRRRGGEGGRRESRERQDGGEGERGGNSEMKSVIVHVTYSGCKSYM